MISQMVAKENARITHEWSNFHGDEADAINLAGKQGERLKLKAEELGYRTVNCYFVPDADLFDKMLKSKYKNLG